MRTNELLHQKPFTTNSSSFVMYWLLSNIYFFGWAVGILYIHWTEEYKFPIVWQFLDWWDLSKSGPLGPADLWNILRILGNHLAISHRQICSFDVIFKSQVRLRIVEGSAVIEQLDGSGESDATDVEMDLFRFIHAENAKQIAKKLNLAQIGGY